MPSPSFLPFLSPMLALSGPLPERNDDFAYEFKWDGMRGIVALDHGRIRVTSRHGRDFTTHFPELQEFADATRRQRLLLDGEIICADDAGKPCFATLRNRIVLRDKIKIAAAARRAPVMFMAFDLLHVAGKDLTPLPYTERRARLDGLGLRGRHWETPHRRRNHPTYDPRAEPRRRRREAAQQPLRVRPAFRRMGEDQELPDADVHGRRLHRR